MWMFRGYNIPNYLLKSTLPPLLSMLATTGVQQRSRVVSINDTVGLFAGEARSTRWGQSRQSGTLSDGSWNIVQPVGDPSHVITAAAMASSCRWVFFRPR